MKNKIIKIAGAGISGLTSAIVLAKAGYKVDLLLQSGTTDNGERYDAVQLRRRYNHLAICDRARGGQHRAEAR